MARDPERREQLLAAADRAIDRHGPAVTMEDLAAEAGVTKPILYRHFGDKGGLYEALARRYAQTLHTVLEDALAQETNWRARVEVTLRTYLATIEARPQLYRFLLHRAAADRPGVSQAVGDFTHQVAQRLAGILAEEFNGAGFRLPHPELTAQAIIGAAQQAGDWWLADPQIGREEVVEVLTRLVWGGLPSLAEANAATGGP